MSEPGTPLLTTGIGAPKFVERQQVGFTQSCLAAEMHDDLCRWISWIAVLIKGHQPGVALTTAGRAVRRAFGRC